MPTPGGGICIASVWIYSAPPGTPRASFCSRVRPLLIAFAVFFVPATVAAETGRSSHAIVGGVETADYRSVPLLYSEDAAGTNQLCSGAVISPRVILTAAHCLQFDAPPSTFFAYFGSDFNGEDPLEIGTVDVVEFMVHPDWNREDPEAGNDVGLIVLAEQAPVPALRINRSAPALGETTRLVGWGQTSGEFSDAGVKRSVISTINEVDGKLMRYGNSNANACRGDSGGPNFMNVGGLEVIAGISSFGDAGCRSYGAATRVDYYAADYIEPFVDEVDPPSCSADNRCALNCASPDPDCGGAVTSGCQAAGGETNLVSALFLVLVGFLLSHCRHSIPTVGPRPTAR